MKPRKVRRANGSHGYEIRWREAGRHRSLTLDTAAEARRVHAEIANRKRLGTLAEIHAGEQTLAEFTAAVWWPVYARPNLRRSTRLRYAQVWDTHVGPRLGSYRLREISVEVVQGFATDLGRARVGAATQRKALYMLQAVMKLAQVRGEVRSNPVALVAKAPYEREREPLIFLPADVERIRAGLELRDRTLVALLAYAGPRPEEALRVRWQDVGSQAVRFDGRKTRRDRWTPLLASLAQDLREWQLASGRPGPRAPLFPAHDGEPWQTDDYRNWRRRVWREVAPAGSRPRDLRSSYVTLRVYEGVPLTTIAREVGTSVAMLDRHYAGTIANWDGERVAAEEQVRRARAERREAV